MRLKYAYRHTGFSMLRFLVKDFIFFSWMLVVCTDITMWGQILIVWILHENWSVDHRKHGTCETEILVGNAEWAPSKLRKENKVIVSYTYSDRRICELCDKLWLCISTEEINMLNDSWIRNQPVPMHSAFWDDNNNPPILIGRNQLSPDRIYLSDPTRSIVVIWVNFF